METMHPMTPWCEGCKKRVKGRCTVYDDPLKKTWHLGCNFSPLANEAYMDQYYKEHPELVRNRQGQQKGRRKNK